MSESKTDHMPDSDERLVLAEWSNAGWHIFVAEGFEGQRVRTAVPVAHFFPGGISDKLAAHCAIAICEATGFMLCLAVPDEAMGEAFTAHMPDNFQKHTIHNMH